MGTIAFIGGICMAVWVLLMGLVQFFDLKFANRDKILGGLAIVAGAISLVSILATLASLNIPR